MARTLTDRLDGVTGRVPSRAVPDWIVRIASLFDPSLEQVVSELGKVKNPSNEKARSRLGWMPRSNEEAIIASAESLIALSLLQSTK